MTKEINAIKKQWRKTRGVEIGAGWVYWGHHKVVHNKLVTEITHQLTSCSVYRRYRWLRWSISNVKQSHSGVYFTQQVDVSRTAWCVVHQAYHVCVWYWYVLEWRHISGALPGVFVSLGIIHRTKCGWVLYKLCISLWSCSCTGGKEILSI